MLIALKESSKCFEICGRELKEIGVGVRVCQMQVSGI